MCYYVDSKLTNKEIREIFNVETNFKEFDSEKMLSGFRKRGVYDKKLPIILNTNPSEAVLGDWGIVPDWTGTRAFQRSTLNARLEEIEEKKSFKTSVGKRCLVPVNGFYEWKSFDKEGNPDPEGTLKQLHYIRLDNGGKPFALAGIYNVWNRNDQGLLTFSIVTTNSNTLMTDIHNSKKRMPVVLKESEYESWLEEPDYMKFTFPNHDVDLIIENLEPNKVPPPAPTQTSLF